MLITDKKFHIQFEATLNIWMVEFLIDKGSMVQSPNYGKGESCEKSGKKLSP